MIGNLKEFEKELSKYDMVKIKITKFNENELRYEHSSVETHSHAFDEFIFNFNRILSIYSEILESKQKKDDFKYYAFCQTAIILAISSLEVYLTTLFFHFSKLISVENIKYKDYQKLLNTFRLGINNAETNYKALGKIRIFFLLPERLNLQRPDNLKIVFKLFDINIQSMCPKLHVRIFSDNEDSYMKIRHRIIHGRYTPLGSKFEQIEIETVENCMIDITKFNYLIDKHIVEKYPDLQFYGTYFQKIN